MRVLRAFAVSLIAFLLLDAVWLSLAGIAIFKAEAGALIRTEPNMVAAIAFYIIYALGMAVLVVSPALAERSLGVAAMRGAALGLTAYATFDLTNLAVVAGWPLRAALIDMTWGTVATAFASVAAFAIVDRARPA